MTRQPEAQLRWLRAPLLRSDAGVQRLLRDVATDKIGEEPGKAVRREFISGRQHFVDRPPPVFAHEGALEIIPTADIDLVLVDPNEIEALPLTRGLARVRHRKNVFSYPDQGTYVSRHEATFFGEFSPQRIGRGFASRDATTWSDPEVPRPGVVWERLEEQYAIVAIQYHCPHSLPNHGHVVGVRIRSFHEPELSAA
jgi:hypothetical protein